MDEKLLKKYLEYASTDEAFAVLFVKKHLFQAKGHWVDIYDFHRYEMAEDDLHFKFVIGSLFQRKIQPQYPPKSDYTVDGRFDERSYYEMTRAITWEAAHKDIDQQKSKKVAARRFKITGVSYNKNRDNSAFFRADAPPDIKALAENLGDRTNPLWDRAMEYATAPEFVYEIRKIQIS